MIKQWRQHTGRSSVYTNSFVYRGLIPHSTGQVMTAPRHTVILSYSTLHSRHDHSCACATTPVSSSPSSQSVVPCVSKSRQHSRTVRYTLSRDQPMIPEHTTNNNILLHNIVYDLRVAADTTKQTTASYTRAKWSICEGARRMTLRPQLTKSAQEGTRPRRRKRQKKSAPKPSRLVPREVQYYKIAYDDGGFEYAPKHEP